MKTALNQSKVRVPVFKVQIIGSYATDTWYAKKIGETFEVFEPYPNPWGFEETTTGFSIYRHDCRVIS